MSIDRPAISVMRYSLRHPFVRLGVLSSLIAGGAMVAAAAMWWPAYRVHVDLTEQLAAGQRGLVDARQAGELAKAYAKALHDVPRLEQKLETAINQTQLVDGLGYLAREQGILILHQTYAERSGESGGGDLVVELAVEGPYEAIRNFLHGLQTLPIWVEVQEVQLAQTDDEAVVKGKLRMISFRRRAVPVEGGV